MQVIETKAQSMRGEQSEHNKAAAGPFFESVDRGRMGPAMARWRCGLHLIYRGNKIDFGTGTVVHSSLAFFLRAKGL